MEADSCTTCLVPLKKDEIAIYKKLVNRGAKEYLCIPCLARYFRCEERDIQNRIVKLKEMGCTLFVE